jgi:hypothetical protein
MFVVESYYVCLVVTFSFFSCLILSEVSADTPTVTGALKLILFFDIY